MNKTMSQHCRWCRRDFAEGSFTKDGVKRRQCRACSKLRLQRSRGATVARRVYFNLKQLMRNHGFSEGALWRLKHVERLLGPIQPSDAKTVKIIRLDDSQPWLVDNAKVVVR